MLAAFNIKKRGYIVDTRPFLSLPVKKYKSGLVFALSFYKGASRRTQLIF
jgi:hypothetical protein